MGFLNDTVPTPFPNPLVQVPETIRVPGNWDLKSQRKGFKRYDSPKLRALVAKLDAAKVTLGNPVCKGDGRQGPPPPGVVLAIATSVS